MDNDLKQFLEGMESRLKEYVNQAETHLKEYVNQRVHVAETRLESQLKEYIDERTHDAETRLLRGFASFQDANHVRMRKIEADVSNVNASTSGQLESFNKKLLELEMRIVDLEGRKPPQAPQTGIN